MSTVAEFGSQAPSTEISKTSDSPSTTKPKNNSSNLEDDSQQYEQAQERSFTNEASSSPAAIQSHDATNAPHRDRDAMTKSAQQQRDQGEETLSASNPTSYMEALKEGITDSAPTGDANDEEERDFPPSDSRQDVGASRSRDASSPATSEVKHQAKKTMGRKDTPFPDTSFSPSASQRQHNQEQSREDLEQGKPKANATESSNPTESTAMPLYSDSQRPQDRGSDESRDKLAQNIHHQAEGQERATEYQISRDQSSSSEPPSPPFQPEQLEETSSKTVTSSLPSESQRERAQPSSSASPSSKAQKRSEPSPSATLSGSWSNQDVVGAEKIDPNELSSSQPTRALVQELIETEGAEKVLGGGPGGNVIEQGTEGQNQQQEDVASQDEKGTTPSSSLWKMLSSRIMGSKQEDQEVSSPQHHGVTGGGGKTQQGVDESSSPRRNQGEKESSLQISKSQWPRGREDSNKMKEERGEKESASNEDRHQQQDEGSLPPPVIQPDEGDLSFKQVLLSGTKEDDEYSKSRKEQPSSSTTSGQQQDEDVRAREREEEQLAPSLERRSHRGDHQVQASKDEESSEFASSPKPRQPLTFTRVPLRGGREDLVSPSRQTDKREEELSMSREQSSTPPSVIQSSQGDSSFKQVPISATRDEQSASSTTTEQQQPQSRSFSVNRGQREGHEEESKDSKSEEDFDSQSNPTEQTSIKKEKMSQKQAKQQQEASTISTREQDQDQEKEDEDKQREEKQEQERKPSLLGRLFGTGRSEPATSRDSRGQNEDDEVKEEEGESNGPKSLQSEASRRFSSKNQEEEVGSFPSMSKQRLEHEGREVRSGREETPDTSQQLPKQDRPVSLLKNEKDVKVEQQQPDDDDSVDKRLQEYTDWLDMASDKALARAQQVQYEFTQWKSKFDELSSNIRSLRECQEGLKPFLNKNNSSHRGRQGQEENQHVDLSFLPPKPAPLTTPKEGIFLLSTSLTLLSLNLKAFVTSASFTLDGVIERLDFAVGLMLFIFVLVHYSSRKDESSLSELFKMLMHGSTRILSFPRQIVRVGFGKIRAL